MCEYIPNYKPFRNLMCTMGEIRKFEKHNFFCFLQIIRKIQFCLQLNACNLEYETSSKWCEN